MEWTCYEVLNPAIRMSWINKQWEKKYIDDANEKILETVSIYCQFWQIVFEGYVNC